MNKISGNTYKAHIAQLELDLNEIKSLEENKTRDASLENPKEVRISNILKRELNFYRQSESETAALDNASKAAWLRNLARVVVSSQNEEDHLKKIKSIFMKEMKDLPLLKDARESDPTISAYLSLKCLILAGKSESTLSNVIEKLERESKSPHQLLIKIREDPTLQTYIQNVKDPFIREYFLNKESSLEDIIKSIQDEDQILPYLANSDVSLNIEELSQIILTHELEVNLPDEEGNTPLHSAILRGNHTLVNALLENGADYQLKNKEGLTPVQLASLNQFKSEIHAKIFRELLFRTKEQAISLLKEKVQLESRERKSYPFLEILPQTGTAGTTLSSLTKTFEGSDSPLIQESLPLLDKGSDFLVSFSMQGALYKLAAQGLTGRKIITELEEEIALAREKISEEKDPVKKRELSIKEDKLIKELEFAKARETIEIKQNGALFLQKMFIGIDHAKMGSSEFTSLLSPNQVSAGTQFANTLLTVYQNIEARKDLEEIRKLIISTRNQGAALKEQLESLRDGLDKDSSLYQLLDLKIGYYDQKIYELELQEKGIALGKGFSYLSDLCFASQSLLLADAFTRDLSGKEMELNDEAGSYWGVGAGTLGLGFSALASPMTGALNLIGKMWTYSKDAFSNIPENIVMAAREESVLNQLYDDPMGMVSRRDAESERLGQEYQDLRLQQDEAKKTRNTFQTQARTLGLNAKSFEERLKKLEASIGDENSDESIVEFLKRAGVNTEGYSPENRRAFLINFLIKG